MAAAAARGAGAGPWLTGPPGWDFVPDPRFQPPGPMGGGLPYSSPQVPAGADRQRGADLVNYFNTGEFYDRSVKRRMPMSGGTTDTAAAPEMQVAGNSDSATLAGNMAAAIGEHSSVFEGGGESPAREFGEAVGGTAYGGLGAATGLPWLAAAAGLLGSWIGGEVAQAADSLSGGAVSRWVEANPGALTAAQAASWLPIGGSAAGKVSSLVGRAGRLGATHVDSIARTAHSSAIGRMGDGVRRAFNSVRQAIGAAPKGRFLNLGAQVRENRAVHNRFRGAIAKRHAGSRTEYFLRTPFGPRVLDVRDTLGTATEAKTGFQGLSGRNMLQAIKDNWIQNDPDIPDVQRIVWEFADGSTVHPFLVSFLKRMDLGVAINGNFV